MASFIYFYLEGRCRWACTWEVGCGVSSSQGEKAVFQGVWHAPMPSALQTHTLSLSSRVTAATLACQMSRIT